MKYNYLLYFILYSFFWVAGYSQNPISPNSDNILYVNQSVNGGNGSGDSWDNAIPELADALKWANDNKAANLWDANNPLKIYVAKGTYKPKYTPEDGKGFSADAQYARDRTFLMVKDVELYGGFDPANGVTELTHARILPDKDGANLNGTILSGDLDGDDVVGTMPGRGAASISGNEENVYHVVMAASATEDVEVKLHGFNISGGNANGFSGFQVNGANVSRRSGGGIYSYSSSSSSSSSVVLTNSSVYNNSSSESGGGGIYSFSFSNSSYSSSSVVLTNSSVYNNSSSYGGGIYSSSSSNSYSSSYFNSSVVLTNSSVYNNSSSDGGGILSFSNSSSSPGSSSVVLTNSSVYNNRSNNGGGIYSYSSYSSNSSVVLTNSSVYNNSSSNGGGIYSYSYSNFSNEITLINSTLAGNIGGSCIYFDGSGVKKFTAHNSMVYGNVKSEIDDSNSVLDSETGTILKDIQFSLVQGENSTADGNLDGTLAFTDLFADGSNGDYSLQSGSPAIDAGKNALYSGDIDNDTDLAGNPRLFGTAIDMGAYESQTVQYSPNSENILYVNQSVDQNATGYTGVGDSWANAIPELADALKWANDNKAADLWDANNPLKIYVAKGIYKPKYTPEDGKGFSADVQYARDRTFLMVKDVKLYGGFDPANGVTKLTHARILPDKDGANPIGTILSGDLDGNDVIGSTPGQGTAPISGNEENVYHVVIAASATEDVVVKLDGIAVTGGNADGSFGLQVNGANVSRRSGGGIYSNFSSSSSVHLTNSSVYNNSSSESGGGIYSYSYSYSSYSSSSVVLTNSSVYNNSSSYGGGIYSSNSSSSSYSNSSVVLTNSSVYNNSSGVGGGGIYSFSNSSSSPGSSSVVLTNSSVYNNRSNNGGGIYSYSSSYSNSSVVLTNSSVYNNSSSNGGGIHSFSNSSNEIKLINSTLAGNIGDSYIYFEGYGAKKFTAHNSIVYGNVKSETDDSNSTLDTNTGTISKDIQFSLVQGENSTANGNLDGTLAYANLFADALNGDYSLGDSSPAVDAGNNALYPDEIDNDTDLAGNPRLSGCNVDIGAYENQSNQGTFCFTPDMDNILYINQSVDQNATGYTGVGDSWANAIPELADALKWANDNKAANLWDANNPLKIYVAKGTYKPKYTPEDGKGFSADAQYARDRTFLMVKDVELYGGFDPANGVTELTHARIIPDKDEANLNGTILSGDLDGDDVVGTMPGRGAALISGNEENVYHVVMAASATEDVEVKLDGFNISGGNANGSSYFQVNGGAVYNDFGGGISSSSFSSSSSVRLTNSSVYNNSSGAGGGGIYSFSNSSSSSSVHLTNSSVYNSSSAYDGGGILSSSSSSSSVHLTNSSVYNNRSNNGGGIYSSSYSSYSSVVLRNSSVYNNSSSDFGGGIYSSSNSSSSVVLTNSSVYNNRSNNGGGIYSSSNSSSSVLLTNSSVYNNRSNNGGGIYSYSSSSFSVVLTNSSVYNNRSSYGGGIFSSSSSSNEITLTNSTLAGNIGGAYIYFDGSGAKKFTAHNSIVYGNVKSETDNSNSVLDSETGTISKDIQFSLVQGENSTADGNLDGTLAFTDLFADGSNGDYSLTACSPAVNAGSNSLLTGLDANSKDLAGNPRVYDFAGGGIIDMGAYEFQGEHVNYDNVLFEDTDVTYNGIAHTITATNLPTGVTDSYVITDVEGTVVTEAMDAGVYTVTVTLSGCGLDKTLTATLTIEKATLTVTADANQNKVYGDSDPEFTYTVSGYQDADDNSILSGALSRIPGEDVGTYAIGQGDLSAGANYEIDFTSADFEITKATLTVTADANQNKVYGDSDPEFTYTVSGYQGADDQTILTGALNRIPGEDVGTYAIGQGDLSAGANYEIDFTSADFEITKATLTVTADANQNKVYGDSDPEFTYTVSGYQGADDQTILTGALNRIPGEDVGTYVIGQGDLSAGANYEIDFIGADFEITTATLTVTADANQSKVYGEADPVLTYTVSGFQGSDDETVLTGSLSRAAGEGVGSYPIDQGDLSAGGNYNIDFAGADFAITKATITGITFENASFTYDGTAKSLAISGTLPTGTSVNYTNNNQTDAGSFTVTAEIDGGNNYENLTLTATLTINKAAITGITFEGASFTYDGTVKSLVIAGTLPTGTSVSYTGNDQTDAGSYTVTAEIDGGTNYEDLTLTAQLTIEKAPIAGITLNDASFTYDGTAKSLMIAGTLQTGTSVTYTNNDQTEAGSYTVTAEIDGGNNYEDLTLNAQLTIEKAPIAGITLDDVTFIYDGTAKSLMIAGTLPTGTSVSYTNNNQTDAGSYTVTAEIDGGTNYEDLTLTAELIIEKATITGITLDDAAFTYDGTSRSLVIAGTLPTGTSVTYTNNDQTEAGSYTVTAEIDGGNNYEDLTLTAELIIEKATITGITLDDAGFTYDGTAKSLAIAGTLPTGTSVTYTNNDQTEAGSYTVTAEIDGGTNYEDLTLTAELIIEKATITGITLDDATFIYDGTAKSLAIAGTLPTGTSVSYTGNDQTDAGSYTVTAEIDGGTNYEDLILTAELTIEKASITGISFTDASFTYDGTAKSLMIAGTLPTGTSVSYTGNDQTNAGSYTVTAEIDGGTNYEDLTLTAELTIEKAPITGITLDDATFTYDGTVKSLMIAGTLPTGTSVSYTNNNQTDAGSYTVTAEIDGGNNYEDLTLTAELIIEKATITGITLDDAAFTYDGTSKSLVIAGTLPTGTSVSYTGNDQTDAGSYTVTAEIDGGTNYEDLTLTAELTIEKALIAGITLNDASFTYDGTVKSLAIAGTLPTGTSVSYTGNDQTDAGSYTVTAEIDGGTNYEDLTLTAQLTIEKAPIAGITLNDASFTYDGTAKSLMIAGTLPTGTSVSYTNNNQTDAGSYTVTAEINGGTNYEDLTLTAELTIEKAPIAGVTLNDATFIYDGTAKSLMIAGTLPTGTSVNYTGNDRTDAGSYTVTAEIDGGNNYEDLTLTAQLTIEKASIEGITLDDASFTYDGTAKSLMIAGTLPTGTSVSYTNNDQTDAGSYTVTAEIDGGTNYEDLTLTATLTIEKATQKLTFEALAVLLLEEASDFQLAAHSDSGLAVSYSYTYESENPSATVTPEGWVSLQHAGVIVITAFQEGNENYLAAEPVNRKLRIESRDASIHRLIIEGEIFETLSSVMYYTQQCDALSNEVRVEIDTEYGAWVSPSHNFVIATPRAGIYRQSVEVISENGEVVRQYEIVVNRPFAFEDIVVQKFDNTLLVNNNPATNGGYRFIGYQWYRNDKPVGNEQIYSAGSSLEHLLEETATYRVVLTTDSGEEFHVCPSYISYKHNFGLKVYPNPVDSGGELHVVFDYPSSSFKGAIAQLYAVSGQHLLTIRLEDRSSVLRLPDMLQSGTYLLLLYIEGQRETVKIVVKP
ncbi:MBG domain-containing protein [Myroides indicus]|uniref:Uncharacterized protein n=1 Tax=Myroides indicus TaxID=1323422 RepID=A0A4R7EYE9_9FLAO|nr:MBG domain-containing protein [Myroides indicus]TDS58821.1 hypothetical protein C8P70_1113 [Myroides indicus]